MNIINQLNEKFLTKKFFKKIGPGKIMSRINLHRQSKSSPLRLTQWLIVIIFSRKSLYRASEAPEFTPGQCGTFLKRRTSLAD